MPARPPRPERFSVVFPEDGSEPFAVLPLGSIWPGHPEAEAIANVIWHSGSKNRDWGVTVARCLEIRTVAGRHGQGVDVLGNPVTKQEREGAKRVLQKIDDCLRSLASHGVAGAAAALVRDGERERQTDSSSPRSAGQAVAPSVSTAQRAPRAWVVRAGQKGENVEHNLKTGVVTFGWDQLPDLRRFDTIDELKEYLKIEPDFAWLEANPNKVGRHASQLWTFRTDIGAGDLVVLPLKRRSDNSSIAIGYAMGPYEYDPGQVGGALHRIPVNWVAEDIPRSIIDAVDPELLKSIDRPGTVNAIKTNDAAARLRHLASDLRASESTRTNQHMFVLTWNPQVAKMTPKERRAHDAKYRSRIDNTDGDSTLEGWWTTGKRKSGISKGDQLMLFLHGSEGGIIAGGIATSEIYPDGDINCVDVRWSRWVDAEDGLPTEALRQFVAPRFFAHGPRASGQQVNDEEAESIRSAWQELAAEPGVLTGDEAGIRPNSAAAVPEGAMTRTEVNRYERSKWARTQCLKHYGYRCQVCGLDFAIRYGKLGKGFMHVHHVVPLNQVADDPDYRLDPIKDLRPVCPNCHAMLHRTRDKTLTVDELVELMQQEGAAADEV